MTEPVLDVICLCAAWCGTCTQYRSVFDALQAASPSHRFRWVDIEDEAVLVGELDVETFPTLVLAHGGRVCFAGPVLPRLGDAQRLLDVTQRQVASGEGGSGWAAGLPETQVAACEALARAVQG